MSDSRFPLFSSNFTQKDPWLIRIRENAKQLLSVSRLAPTSANGAAFHLLSFEHTRREGSAQSASLLTHGFAVGALVLFALHSPLRPACPDCVQKPSGPITYTAPLNPFHPKPGTSGNESGSDNNPIPATRGLLPPHSSIALAPPRIPENSSVKAPVPQAILDREAPELTAPVNDIGLPWMAEKTDSGGPGPGKGIGNGPGRRVGDGPDGGQGVGTPGMGHDGIASEPTCSYCPTPVYTDEARHEKIQGSVTLQVFVGADGRPLDVRVSKGLGLGLDERATQTIRGWHFNPAKDGTGHAVASWVTIETIFRLF